MLLWLFRLWWPWWGCRRSCINNLLCTWRKHLVRIAYIVKFVPNWVGLVDIYWNITITHNIEDCSVNGDLWWIKNVCLLQSIDQDIVCVVKTHLIGAWHEIVLVVTYPIRADRTPTNDFKSIIRSYYNGN